MCFLARDQCGADVVRSDPTTWYISPQEKFKRDTFYDTIISCCLDREMYVGTNTWPGKKLLWHFSSKLPLIYANVIPNCQEGYYRERQPPCFRTQLPDSSFEMARFLNPGSGKVPAPDWWTKKGCRRHQKRQSRSTPSSPRGFSPSSYRILACRGHNFPLQHFPAR